MKKKKTVAKKKSGPVTSGSRAAQASQSGKVLYLYGFSPNRANVEAVGVDGKSSLEALVSEGMVAWISRVDRREFADELSDHMENLEWLAEAGVNHQRAVSAIAAETTVLPARFGTIFVSEASLAAHAKAGKKALTEGFRRVEGCDEWGVKIFAERPSIAAVQASSGSDYLKQKSSALRAQSQNNADDEDLQVFAAELAKLARAAAPAGKVSSGERGLMWQASFLLPRSKRMQWDSALKKWANRWGEERRIEASGPWPPYSFV